MGYSTFFKGAIKITPRLSDKDVIYINTFLSMRHHQGLENPEVKKDFTIQAWPDINETFKAQFIPDPKPYLQERRDILEKYFNAHGQSDVDISTEIIVDIPKGFPDSSIIHQYNSVQEPYFSLWSNLRLYQAKNCTYLAWDESEKAYNMYDWFTFMGDVIHILYPDAVFSGCVKAQGEDPSDKWTVEVIDNTIYITRNTSRRATNTKVAENMARALQNPTDTSAT